jgi:hypothetical protein
MIMLKRGDTPTNIIMFLTAMIAILIGFTWVLKHNYPFHKELGRVDQQLLRFQVEFAAACNNKYYESRINPSVDYGLLSLRDDEVCINSNICNRFVYSKAVCGLFPGVFRCRPLICSTGMNQDINLKEITYIYIEKNQTFEVTSE